MRVVDWDSRKVSVEDEESDFKKGESWVLRAGPEVGLESISLMRTISSALIQSCCLSHLYRRASRSGSLLPPGGLKRLSLQDLHQGMLLLLLRMITR